MKRILTVLAALAIAVALGRVVLQLLPTAPTQAEQTAAKDESTLSDSRGDDKAPEGLINMPPERIAAQEIEVAPVEKGALARVLSVPGTITLDAALVARVPARVVGTVTQMHKRLGDTVTQGEVVAVLDSREVADAKSEYLTASVTFDLQKTSIRARADSCGPRGSPPNSDIFRRARHFWRRSSDSTSPGRSSPRSNWTRLKWRRRLSKKAPRLPAFQPCGSIKSARSSAGG